MHLPCKWLSRERARADVGRCRQCVLVAGTGLPDNLHLLLERWTREDTVVLSSLFLDGLQRPRSLPPHLFPGTYLHFFQNPWEPLRTKGNRAISNVLTQQRLAERKLNWGRGGGGWKHETLFPKILCVFPPIPETELWGLSSSRKPARSTSRSLGRLLLTTLFSPAPGCCSVPSLHLQGWLSWSCRGCCLSASSPQIPRTLTVPRSPGRAPGVVRGSSGFLI